MDKSAVHQVWPEPSCKAQWKRLVSWCFEPNQQWKGEEDKADRGGNTTLGNGQAWSSLSPRGLWRREKKMEEPGCEVIGGAPMTPAVNGWVKVKESCVWMSIWFFVSVFCFVRFSLCFVTAVFLCLSSHMECLFCVMIFIRLLLILPLLSSLYFSFLLLGWSDFF